MGGTSTQQQSQQSQTNPWDPAQPMLKSILGQLQGPLGNTGLTGAESGALNQLSANAAGGNPFAGRIGAFSDSLLAGGGANDQNGALQSGLDTFRSQMMPCANGSMVGQNPALKAQLDTIMSDVGNNVNSQFAAAGRDMSGANQMAYGRGVAQGVAPVLAAQYNADADRQLNASGALYGAQNTTSGAITGNNQQSLTNKMQGVSTSQAALDAKNYGPNAILQVEAAKRGIPASALALMAQIGVPIAGLGGQSTGTSSGSKTDSGMTQFMQFGQGLGSLLSGGGNFMKNMPSDRRVKEDVAHVGALFDGTPVYRYRYVGSIQWQIGLMAQDVEKTTPNAVAEIGGIKTVDYEAATERSREMAEAA